MMHCPSLLSLLQNAASLNPSCGLLIQASDPTSTFYRIPYSVLLRESQKRSSILRHLTGFQEGSPILLHFEEHSETLFWFWAVLWADAVPVLTGTFSHIPEQRQRYLDSLASLLTDPICITSEKLAHLFEGNKRLYTRTAESLQIKPNGTSALDPPYKRVQRYTDLAMLMLTSGSTGAPKAVRLRHSQILSAVASKSSFRKLPAEKPFLNWIGLDHVASIVEIHLTAMYSGLDQIHLYATNVIAEPLKFLDVLSNYQVTRTFAPNFFLAKLLSALKTLPEDARSTRWNFANLRWLGSGGEANDTVVCSGIAEALSNHGAPQDVLVPGFGMTETCAGIIYNLNCPSYDKHCAYPFTSLGKCIPGVKMRVTLPSIGQDTLIAAVDEPGNLELCGSAVFDGYFRNSEATAEAFTADGWFKTGDQAIIDASENLRLTGRVKETMIINGLKHYPQDVETVVNQALSSNISRLVCFPYRGPGSDTEQVCLAYTIRKDLTDTHDYLKVQDLIVQLVVLHIGARPYVLALADDSDLPTTTLGKISRARMRALLENGHFRTQEELQRSRILDRQKPNTEEKPSDAERLLLEDFQEAFGIDSASLGLDTPIFEFGVTSIDIIRLKKRLGDRLDAEIPITTLLLNPTPRTMAQALRDLSSPKVYDPIVPLRTTGSKTALWLIHPGVGEVLVFLNLAKKMPLDRPIYALRARGFDSGQNFFSDIAEAVDTYFLAIKRTQPAGPYAIAGYSFGTMLAFEVCKRLEQSGDEVRFMGSFNLPPHIKWRMRQLDWTSCLLHLAYFLSLITEVQSDEIAKYLGDAHVSSREETLRVLLQSASPERLAELSLDSTSLEHWADLAHALQAMARDYEPQGSVGVLDVFYAEPLKVSAPNKEEWMRRHLIKWRDFCRSDVKFHEVAGAHYTMLAPEYVESFAMILEKTLEERGV
ncbi:MAG: hypothetical protein Q9227_003482 [Pyrenula ochraceoflavens]